MLCEGLWEEGSFDNVWVRCEGAVWGITGRGKCAHCVCGRSVMVLCGGGKMGLKHQENNYKLNLWCTSCSVDAEVMWIIIVQFLWILQPRLIT